MSIKYEELKSLVAAVADDVEKSKTNKAAGTRVRKAMQDIKSKAQEIRIEVQDARNAGKAEAAPAAPAAAPAIEPPTA
jgi:hypothetical protein